MTRLPKLAPLFPDAEASTADLARGKDVFVRRQYWPLLVDGQVAAFLMSTTEFHNQKDALAGQDALGGTLRVTTFTDSYIGQSGYSGVLGEAGLRDVQALMSQLQLEL